MSYQLIDSFQKIEHPKILVLGDLILDSYVWGDAERISQEAPVILLREQTQEYRLGGAANVAHMLRGLEVDVCMAGAVGNDDDGKRVVKALYEQNVDCSCIVFDDSRPTTLKERFMGRAQHRHPHQILRVDREVRTPLSHEIANQLLAKLLPNLTEYQAILISDYAKGVCTEEVLTQLIPAARKAGLPIIVDPAASGDYAPYTGATAITPNRLETSRATGRSITTVDDAFGAGRKLVAELNLDHAFITLDSDGIAVVRSTGEQTMLPTRKREVYDITGAGDMVLAMIGIGAAAGLPAEELAQLANVAGGLEVEQIGVVAISREEILSDIIHNQKGQQTKVCQLDDLARHVAARRKTGQRVVFTNGCFDVLHVGHVTYLQQAAQEGDCLIVGVNSDESVRQLDKGTDRPIISQESRAAMLAALEVVDYVVIFNEETPCHLLEVLKPDLLVKGGTYNASEIVGHEIVKAYGGQVKPMGIVPGISTTEILNRVRSSNNEQESNTPFQPESQRKAG